MKITWVGTAIVLLAAACVTGSEPEPTDAPGAGLHHVVVDTDLAFDDIMALLYLAERDDVAIDAVTIAGTGEAHCDPGVSNALGLLALAGIRDTPVACGRSTPLQGSNAFPDEWRAAVDDLSMLDLPQVDAVADPRGAVELLLDTLDGDATLLTLGPLTNVAEALREDPALGDRVPTFIAMAGAIDVPGNTPNSVAEYNVWVDPLAAKEAFEGMDVTLVPLDATNDVPFTPFFLDTLSEHATTPVAEAVESMIRANQEIFLATGYSFWDTLAAVLVLRPELATWDDARVVVTASQDAGAGWIDRWSQGTHVRFADSVPDPLAFEREYLSVVTGQEVDDVRPAPTLTIAFDGERCTIEPRALTAGTQVVAYVDERANRSEGAVLVRFGRVLTYEDLRELLGPDGSVVPEGSEPAGLHPVTFVEDLTEATTRPSVIAGLCFERHGREVRVWMSPKVVVEP